MTEEQASYPHTLYVMVDLCVNCGVCKDYCMTQAIIQKEDYVEIDENLCIGCDRCWEACTVNAIDILLK